MAWFILILFSVNSAPTVLPAPYRSAAECHAAAETWDSNSRRHFCLPGGFVR